MNETEKRGTAERIRVWMDIPPEKYSDDEVLKEWEGTFILSFARLCAGVKEVKRVIQYETFPGRMIDKLGRMVVKLLNRITDFWEARH